MADRTLIQRTAVEIVELLRIGAITPHDCLDSLAARITEVDARVNALPTLCFDRAPPMPSWQSR
jgi:amidase